MERDSLSPQLHYWAFALVIFPLLTIIGNILVVLSVLREKYLQTCTNFFVVSLALSDLIVASFVMPLAVYYEITQKWHHSNFMCDLWVCGFVICILVVKTRIEMSVIIY
jgi:hypothetical protein